ncbi:MAG: ATP-binding protein, partial [Thermoleophilia bacterium]|nr:ATP-binding protein [Thermoleophilia bacterium]
MPVDYDQIREENIRYYGEGDRHLFFLQELYDRRTHFVFELLQNADDARATEIEFVVHADRLDVVHNGRLFDEGDVRAICGIAESNKADEDEKIGRFGIGFKSVYSYTDSPAVHSGDEHFRIEKYVRPVATQSRAIRTGMTTLFSLPFNKDAISAEDAAAELKSFFADRAQFPSTVLLFLRHVEVVSWRTVGGSAGKIEAASEQSGDDGRRVLLNRSDFRGSEHEVWLTFSKNLGALGYPKLSVQTAFQVGERDGSPAILRLDRSPLAVFFPTAVETNLGFLVQGPYRTTPARDNLVRDSEINTRIHEEVAELVVQSAIGLRKRGWLDTEALECFPLRPQDFPAESPFSVLFRTFREAVRHEPLIPTHGGGFGRGGLLRVSPSELLPDLFDGDRLEALLGTLEESGTRWVHTDVTPRRRPDLHAYLTRSIGDDVPLAPEMRAIQIVRQLDSDFMEAQSIDWTLRLYEFLDSQNEVVIRQTLATREWVRCEDGKCRAPSVEDEPAVWLPPTTGGDVTYPIVARALARDATVRRLMGRYDVTPRDEVDDILDTVIAYYREPDLRDEITGAENVEHVRRFLDAVA